MYVLTERIKVAHIDKRVFRQHKRQAVRRKRRRRIRHEPGGAQGTVADEPRTCDRREIIGRAVQVKSRTLGDNNRSMVCPRTLQIQKIPFYPQIITGTLTLRRRQQICINGDLGKALPAVT